MKKIGSILAVAGIILLFAFRYGGWDTELTYVYTYQISKEDVQPLNPHQIRGALSQYRIDETGLQKAISSTGLSVKEFKELIAVHFILEEDPSKFDGIKIEFTANEPLNDFKSSLDFIGQGVERILRQKTVTE